ncbi:MAG: glycoside hydrolase family 2 TIM barrel-domain containing protein [Verrucomicrobiota bacterium]
MKKLFLLLLSSGFAASSLCGREIVNLDFDWKFKAGEVVDGQSPSLSDSGWRTLNVPHDWSIEGEYRADSPDKGRGGYLPAGVLWYRKVIDVPADWMEKKVSIEFDSVYMDSTVWINGVELGNRPYGYITFAYDLTPHLKEGENLIAIRVDNTLQPSGRWYTGTGVFGSIELLVTDSVHVKRGSIFFQTLDANSLEATVQAESEVVGDLEAEVFYELIAADGTIVATAKGSGKRKLTVIEPQLWGIDDPNLYTLRTSVKSGGRLVDQVDTTVGIRTLTFNREVGFALNGVSMKMKGVCEHHDGGPVGGAFPEKILRERLELLKAMGTNAIRTSHNPRTKEFYDLCDELGIMVMDEIFDGWHRKAEEDYGGRFFDEWWKIDVEEWIRAKRNHPSIVMYSIGNETGEDDVHDITGYIKKFDTTRPTTGGTIFEGVDIPGYNGPGGMPGAMQRFNQDNPEAITVRTEVPHTLQTRGFYRVRTWWRNPDRPRNEIPDYGTEQIFFDGHPRYSSSYDNAGVRISARTSWRETRDMPWVIGEFRWTGFDYLGEASFGGGKFPARIWNFGIIDLAGLPKDHFWFYQSQWTDEPMVHILPHWTHRFLDPGTVVPIVAYSNCDEVELFLNGESLGRKTEDPEWLEFVWQVPYVPGELKAVGYDNGEPVAQMIWHTAGSPVALRLETNNDHLKADRLDTATITYQAIDADGSNVPWTMNRVDFKFDGPIKNLGLENGDPVDVNPHRINHRNLFYGYGRGFFQATDDDSPVSITAASILGDTLFETSESVAIDVQTVALRGSLPDDLYEIRYSLDGSDPATGVLYEEPFVLDDSTMVKAVVLRNGEEYLHLEQQFLKGERPIVTDPRWRPGYDPSNYPFRIGEGYYEGPQDPEILGLWEREGDFIEFRRDGVVYENPNTPDERPLAFWVYDYPLDPFEAGFDDAGKGQLSWEPLHTMNTEIRITNQDLEELKIFRKRNNPEIYTRVVQ